MMVYAKFVKRHNILCINPQNNEPIPVWREIGMGYSHMSGEATNMGIENSSWVTNGTFPIPHEWLSRRDEIKIPHERRSREWGIFILSQLLSHEWGIGNVPWVTNEEFYSSLFLSRPGFTFPYGKENLFNESPILRLNLQIRKRDRKGNFTIFDKLKKKILVTNRW